MNFLIIDFLIEKKKKLYNTYTNFHLFSFRHYCNFTMILLNFLLHLIFQQSIFLQILLSGIYYNESEKKDLYHRRRGKQLVLRRTRMPGKKKGRGVKEFAFHHNILSHGGVKRNFMTRRQREGVYKGFSRESHTRFFA